MAMSNKKRVVLVSFVLLLILVLVITTKFIIRKASQPKLLYEKTTQIDAMTQKNIKDGELKQLTDSKTKDLYNSFNEKKYDEVITQAKSYCHTLTGNIQLICYSFYGQALQQKNMLSELSKLSDEVLKTDAIKNDVTARNIWEFNSEQSKKGINPKDVQIDGTDSEARK